MATMPGFHFFAVVFLHNHWPILVVYIVLHSCLFFFCFLLLSLFHSYHKSFISLLNHYAHLGRYVHIFIRTNPVRNTPLPVDRVYLVGHKSGTRQDQVKNRRLPPQNACGALVP